MTKLIKAEFWRKSIIGGKPTIYHAKSAKHLKKFHKWARKNQLKPGQEIPQKIFNKYFKEMRNNE